MRVKGKGGGFGSFSGGGDRKERFRRRRKVGEIVRGRIVKRESEELAWVDIEGDQLLAQIGPGPVPGMVLAFKVSSLRPDITLKLVQTPSGGELTTATQDFAATRQAFDQIFSASAFHSQAPSLSPNERRELFHSSILDDSESLAGYHDLLVRQAAINQILDQKFGGRVRFLYLPWLFPGSTNFEAVVKTMAAGPPADPEDEGAVPVPALSELAVGFSLPRLGPGQIRLMYKGPVGGFRIYLERMACADELTAHLETLDLSTLPMALNFLGVQELPSYARGGILSEVMSPAATMIGGVNIRV